MICFIALNSAVIAMLVLGVLFSTITCVAIITEEKGNPKLQWLLFAIFLGISCYYFIHILVLTRLITDFPFLLRGIAPVYYITQPAIYFYVVVNIKENYTFSKKDLIHLLPILYAFIDNWGFYTEGPKHWQFWADSFAKDNNKIPNYQGTIFKAKYNFLLRSILYIAYTLFAWKYYLGYIQLNHKIKDQLVLKWLKLFLITISIFVISVISASIYYSTRIGTSVDGSNYILTLPLMIISLTIIILSSYILFNPILLFGLPRINFTAITDNKRVFSKFKSMKIDKDDFDNNEYKLAAIIVSEIKESQLYTNRELSLDSTSKHFSIPSHHFSYLINTYIQKTFPDIICEMRIDHAIQLLKDNKNKKYTMEAIGNISGFNSRTTFYVSFKKITGISPNEYLQNLKLL